MHDFGDDKIVCSGFGKCGLDWLSLKCAGLVDVTLAQTSCKLCINSENLS